MITRFDTTSSYYRLDGFSGNQVVTTIPSVVNELLEVRVNGVETKDYYDGITSSGFIYVVFNEYKSNVNVEVTRKSTITPFIYNQHYTDGAVNRWLDANIQSIQDLAIDRHMRLGMNFMFAAGANSPYLSSGQEVSVVSSLMSYIRNFLFLGKKTLSQLLQSSKRAMFNTYTGSEPNSTNIDQVDYALEYYAPVSSFSGKSIDVNFGTIEGSFLRSISNTGGILEIVLGHDYGQFMSIGTSVSSAIIYIGGVVRQAAVDQNYGQITLRAVGISNIDISTSKQPLAIELDGNLIPMNIEPLVPYIPVATQEEQGVETTLNEWLTE